MSDKKKKDIPGQEPEAKTSVPAAENAENPAAENAANPAEETIPETFTVTREQMEQMEKLARLLETVDAKYEDSALGRYVKKVAEELEEHTPEIEEIQDLVSGKLVTAKEKLIARVMQLLHNEEENS